MISCEQPRRVCPTISLLDTHFLVWNFNSNQMRLLITKTGIITSATRLANINGWKLLVVANRKTPRNWSYKNVHFLSMDDQLRMGYRITSNLSDKFYAHKNIGYLYAIEHGARWIYDTDDHHIPYGEKN
ncbi:hypothetical protein NECAME_14350 [Necator americanus]|uniref:Uncharacterized protein n=1 Tax=Necator americanus TaxID=51031 RepID=W2SQC7_NECAM|nr:hypothetical protein NECAME_14350 [Necator americanus]ETN71086.1 hypothetical protein NECAME_14350 [Necator americanus]